MTKIVKLQFVVSLIIWVFFANCGYGNAATTWKQYMDEASSKYMFRDDYAGAETDWKKALSLAEQFKTEDNRLSENLIDLAKLYCNLGLYTKAEPLLKRALLIAEKRIPTPPNGISWLLGQKGSTYLKSDWNLAETLYYLGNCYYMRHDYQQAESTYSRAEAVIPRVAEEEQAAASLAPPSGMSREWNADIARKLICISRQNGKYKEAERLYKNFILCPSGLMSGFLVRNSEAAYLCDLILLYDLTGENSLAQTLFRFFLQKNLCIENNNWKQLDAAKLQIKTNLQTKEFMNSLSRNNNAEAKPLVTAALDLSASSNSSAAAETLTYLAAAYLESGQYDSAEQLLNRARSIERQNNGTTGQDFCDQIYTLECCRQLAGLKGQENQAFQIQEEIGKARTNLRLQFGVLGRKGTWQSEWGPRPSSLK